MIQPTVQLERRSELTDFLRTRRARLSPSDVGLLDGARRRTPGLRREEVALLANIGSTWYTRLEQGLPINVSPQVLDSIAQALRLSETEREHLYILAGQPAPERIDENDETVSPLLQRTLDALNPNPAYIRGRRWDILANNYAARVVWGEMDSNGPFARNVLWRFFTEPTMRCLYPHWEEAGPRLVAQFRAVAARYPDCPSFQTLIAALHDRSEAFSRWWAQHNVCNVTEGLKHVNHPEAGEMVLDHTTLYVPDHQDMRVIVFSAEPNSESERKLRALVLGEALQPL
jgi:transcriptional regulator with XRE-family HTH domain